MAEEFRAHFLSDAALRSQFVHMCKAETHDPITDAVAAMLTSNVQFCVGKYGLVLFKGGKPVDRIEGLPTAAQLIARVQSYL